MSKDDNGRKEIEDKKIQNEVIEKQASEQLRKDIKIINEITQKCNEETKKNIEDISEYSSFSDEEDEEDTIIQNTFLTDFRGKDKKFDKKEKHVK
mmetsp:Transcript_32553/g.28821  ORF Transcript_32553/g.28821 Transcript_32553/m.28821 type:complete len:95 (-) Transcript_32553:523-807(-)